MSIGPIAPRVPLPPIAPAQQAQPVNKPNHDQQQAANTGPLKPAPAIRPTLQDNIDVNRTLRMLRGV